MKLSGVLGSLVGGACVYIAMAACSGPDQESPATAAGAGGRSDSGNLDASYAGADARPSAGGGEGADGATGVPNTGGFLARDGSLAAGGGLQDASQGDVATGEFRDAATGQDSGDGLVIKLEASSPVPDARAQYTSGTRIKAKWLTTPDGARHFLGWYDSQRKESCSFAPASDGKLRCTPSAGAATTAVFYSDAKCATPIYVSWKGYCTNSNNKYVALSDANSCPSRTTIMSATAFTGTSFYSGTPTNCTVAAATSVQVYAQSYDFWTAGAVLDPTLFVEASESTE